MIDNLRISYDCGSHVSVTLSAYTDYDNNLPFILAELFARVIKDSNANENMVIKYLSDMIKEV